MALLSTPEVAKLLRIDDQTVRRLIDKGEIDAIRVGRLWKVYSESLRKYL